MPEQVSSSLDSCHSNLGSWQLMFHLQINYGKLLMEENVCFFSLFWISFWSIFFITVRAFPWAGMWLAYRTDFTFSMSVIVVESSFHLREAKPTHLWVLLESGLHAKTEWCMIRKNVRHAQFWIHTNKIFRASCFCMFQLDAGIFSTIKAFYVFD